MSRRGPSAAFVGLLLAGCDRTPGPGPCEAPLAFEAPSGRGRNVLIVLLDDLGVERFSAYPEATRPLPLPTFDRLGALGARFESAYTDPTCSPTRATLLTGRRPRRHGVGLFLDGKGEQLGLPHEERTVPELLRESPLGPWATAAVGKWHLDPIDDRAAPTAPLAQGFDAFHGTAANIDNTYELAGPADYFRWEWNDDGALSERTGYLTTATTDAALAELRRLEPPFFLYVAYHAAHAPFHAPPPELGGAVAAPGGDPELQDAMVRALDAELGRLLDGVDLDDTLVVVLADNGSPESVLDLPPDAHKGTVRDPGVRVPMWVLGGGVPAAAVVEAPVYVADLFATVADEAGIDLAGQESSIDGRSLLPWLEGTGPARACVVSEAFPENGRPWHDLSRSIRDGSHLLVRRGGHLAEHRDLALDRVGQDSLVPASEWTEADRAAYRRLDAWLDDDRRSVR